MKQIFLDTSAYSAFKKGLPETLERIKEADQIFLSGIVLGELLSGFDAGKFCDTNRRELKDFLNHPTVTVTPLTGETSERYSLIYRDLRKRGKPIPTNDLWIAASVMETGSALLTSDRHFLEVKQIQVLFL